MKRREFMKGAAALTVTAGTASMSSPPAHADIPALNATVRRLTGDAPLSAGRVKLDLPVLADNGNSVPLSVSVQSPMSAADHVKAIHLVSERNPEPHMASFFLGPHSGRAQISTRVRMAGSQTVTAIAEMSDGTFWTGSARIQVTLSACVDESDWNK